MTRILKVGAAQLGPIQRENNRKEVVERLIALLKKGAVESCDLVVFPESVSYTHLTLPTNREV